MVQVHRDEGLANHIGPEPCAGNREGVGEASVGERHAPIDVPGKKKLNA